MVLHKILKYLALVIGVIGLVLLGRIIFTGDEPIKASADLQASVVSPFMYVAYIVLAVVLVLVLIFVLKELFSGDIKKTLLTVGAFIIVVAAAYVISSGVETPMKDGDVLSASGSRWVGTGLHTFYFLAIIAIGTMVVTGAKKIFK